MLNFSDVSIRRGTRILFSKACFTIHQGQKVGLTGANGTGKSSLFALIRNVLSTESGEFSMPPGLSIAHVAQETPPLACSALDYVLDGDVGLRDLQQRISQSELANDGKRLAELYAELDVIGGYTANSRAAKLLHGLGFKVSEQQQPVNSFSGGWRMRLNLAQALMCRSDLLLLDEPTNHLDLEATLWLEDWLRNYWGTLLLISHDREFLDRIVGHILHIEQGKVSLYTGNYSDFEVRRAELLAQQQVVFERQQREIKHIQSFITRFKAKASKAKQAQSRIKALARMEVIAQAHVDSPFQFSFPVPEKMPHKLLRLENVDVGYGDKTILSNVTLNIFADDRIGLLGPNGAGKSTLIKMLAGDSLPLSGVRETAQDLKIGYFAQHQLEQLRPDFSPLKHLQMLDRRATEQQLRNFLGGFDFRGDKADADVTQFSGGERARLVLAMLIYQGPNLLLLDEPTNHLDLEIRHALTIALQDFEGAIVLISHDRHLLRTVADDFLLVANGQVQPFAGDLDEYRTWIANQEREADAPMEDLSFSENRAAARKERKRVEAEKRQKLAPLRQQLKKLDESVEKLNRKKQNLAQQLADPAVYEESAKHRLKQLLGEQAQIDKEIQSCEEQWLAISLELEALKESDAA